MAPLLLRDKRWFLFPDKKRHFQVGEPSMSQVHVMPWLNSDGHGDDGDRISLQFE